MRRMSILIILVGFIFAGFQGAFCQEQKGQKGEYQKQMESKLKEFKQKLEELKGKAGELKQEAKEEFDQGMKELQKKEEAANKKLKELNSASTKTWEKISYPSGNRHRRGTDQDYPGVKTVVATYAGEEDETR